MARQERFDSDWAAASKEAHGPSLVMQTPTPFEQLAHATIRIECKLEDGRVSTGTGFFFRFLEDKIADRHVPCLVTNKHVIHDAKEGKLIFTLTAKDGGPDIGKQYAWSITDGFKNAWIQHPDPNVDLAIMPIAQLLSSSRENGHNLFTAT